jgi:hypothetical protein
MKTKCTMTLMFALTFAILIAVPANAAVQLNEKTNVFISVFVPCAAGGTGEVVDLSGDLHTLISFTLNGHNVTGRFHFQPQGISGTGETTGDKYQATGVTQETFKSSLQNGQANFTYVNNFRIVGQGPGNNYLVHETLHLNIRSDGTATVFFDNLRIDCK